MAFTVLNTDKNTTATSVDDIEVGENFLNVKEYFCFYVRADSNATAVTADISTESISISFKVGKGLSGLNGTEGSDPTGVTFSSSAVLGDMGINDTQAIWVEREVTDNMFCSGQKGFTLEIN